MYRSQFFLFLLFFSSTSIAQNVVLKVSIPITIQWVDSISGDFSFTQNWSYPDGVFQKSDGRAGCGDGGFCPQRCYAMIDSNGIVFKDSEKIFYELLDTAHRSHSIQCDAWCYEWLGTDFITAQKNNDTIFCHTAIGIATHCSLQLYLFADTCLAMIDLNSIRMGRGAVFYCKSGYIQIDKKCWKKGILKASFSFDFEHPENPGKPMFWKGLAFSPIH